MSYAKSHLSPKHLRQAADSHQVRYGLGDPRDPLEALCKTAANRAIAALVPLFQRMTLDELSVVSPPFGEKSPTETVILSQTSQLKSAIFACVLNTSLTCSMLYNTLLKYSYIPRRFANPMTPGLSFMEKKKRG